MVRQNKIVGGTVFELGQEERKEAVFSVGMAYALRRKTG